MTLTTVTVEIQESTSETNEEREKIKDFVIFRGVNN